jgi:hypothetical protein
MVTPDVTAELEPVRQAITAAGAVPGDTLTEQIDALANNAAWHRDPVGKRRMEVWRLFLFGWSQHAIAEKLKCSVGTVNGDIKWCQTVLPLGVETAAEFRRMSLFRSEELLRMAMADGDARTAVMIMDFQAKVLGAYAAVKVDGQVTVRHEIVGVDVSGL